MSVKMGFLDLLVGKKKDVGNIPPPAPGLNKKDVFMGPTIPSPMFSPGKSSMPEMPKPEAKQAFPKSLGFPEMAEQLPNKPDYGNKLPEFPLSRSPRPIDSAESGMFGTLKIPEPPMGLSAPTGLQRSMPPQPQKNTGFNYDFSLPAIRTEEVSDETGFAQNVLENEVLDSAKIKPIDDHTDNEDLSLVERRLMVHRTAGGPIFVEVSDYRRILDGVDFMKARMKESEDYVFRIEEYNEKKHKMLEQWKMALEDIQRKLVFVDKTLFEKMAR